MTGRAGVAQRKERGRQGQNKDDVAPRTQERRKYEKRRWKGPELKNRAKSRGLRQHLRSKREFNNILRESLGPQIVKRIAGFSVGLGEITDGHCGGIGPLRNGKMGGTRAGNVKALATRDSFAPTVGKEKH
jgi:hypothetical protein